MADTEQQTIVELLNAATDQIIARQNVAGPGAKREYAIAITEIENAVMRVNRGVAMDKNVFNPADVEATTRG